MAKFKGNVLAIDAGGTKVHVAVVKDGDIIADTKFETRAESGAVQCVDAIVETANGLMAETDTSIQAIGLASPGVVHPVTKKTEHTWNISGWDAYDVYGRLNAEFGVPIAIENDANMAAIAESVYQNPGNSFIFFAIGTGFGSGLILNKRLWAGKKGGAGEIARWVMNPDGLAMDLNYGHLEYLMSGSGFETRYRERTGEAITGGEISARAKAGDQIAREIFREGALYLGMAAANVSTLLDLDAVVLGGGAVVREPELWLPAMKEVTQKLCLYPPEIVLSKLGSQAVLLGAIAEAYRILEEEH